MTLSAGDKLGPYQIHSLIGKGGMGEVYRAHDARVGRDVAVKVSAEKFNERFEREARAIASLNHPNICQLYDVGPNFLVMELIEGESPRGPLPLDEALHIARQIADALDYAHEKGVVHRDLKPGNIKIKPDGVVKVLDFGLAKMAPTPAPATEDSPTFSMAATQAGVILGTAAYMAPEQARGKAVDKRADIWSFGVLLHELLTGKRLFQGEDVTEILASVVKEQPDLSRAPAQLRPLIARCLEKDPKKRLRDIGDVWQLLEAPVASVAPERARTLPRTLPWIIAAALAIGIGVALWAPWRTGPAAPQPLLFQIYPPEKTTFAGGVDNPPAISPDGSQVAFTAFGEDGRSRIWIRDLSALNARVLEGTEEALNLFWSPDSRFIGFRARGELKKVAAAGGPTQSLCACLAVVPSAWSKEGMIVFGNSQGMMKVSAEGGAATQLTTVDPSRGDFIHLLPSFLPDGHHFLYSRASSMPENSGMYVGSIDAKPEQQALQRVLDGFATYVGSGRVLFFREASQPLMTQAFDVDQLKPSGDPAQVVGRAVSFPTVSTNGVLTYGGTGAPWQLTWFDRQGKPVGTIGEPGDVGDPRISPDNRRVAFTRADKGPGSIFLYEAGRGAYQFTFDSANDSPVWSHDGSHIAFFSMLGGGQNLYQKAANGIGKEDLLNKGDTPRVPQDWSQDGKYLLFSAIDPKSKADVWVLPLDGDKKAFPYLNQDYNEDSPRLSPIGPWLAYQSDKSGRYEIYVDTFTGVPSVTSSAARGNWQVSTSGGTRPVWSRDGRELFFIGADGKMMVAEVNNSDANRFDARAAKPLFDAHISGNPSEQFDVSKDGRFLMSVPLQGASTPITVIVNWTAGIKK
jgi:Tol biopolymer transport system component/predicted Ser/Thr protein kinase